MAVLPTASESPLVYACELWVFAMCPTLRGSTISYDGDAHFPKHNLEYSLNLWSQPTKKKGAMGNFGDLWAPLGTHRDFWGPMGTYGALCGSIGIYGTYRDLRGSMDTFWGP